MVRGRHVVVVGHGMVGHRFVEALRARDSDDAWRVTVLAVKADVSDEADIDAMFDTLVKRFGTVDIVVANSGLQKDAKFIDMTLADWNAVMNVNLTGQFMTAQRAVREFLRRGPRPVSKALGKII